MEAVPMVEVTETEYLLHNGGSRRVDLHEFRGNMRNRGLRRKAPKALYTKVSMATLYPTTSKSANR